MGLKTLLVCLTTPEHAETLMKVAVPLARKHNAHLIGLHAVEELLMHPGIAMHFPEAAFGSFKDSQRVEAKAIKNIFVDHTKNEDFQSEFRLVRAEAMSASERMIESARATDLVLMAKGDSVADRPDRHNAQMDVIRHSGRPVIVIPLEYDGPAIGDNIVLGWSDTREAARAAHDLLTIVHEKAAVTILRVKHSPTDVLADHDGIDIAEMYSRHGLETTLEHRDPGDRNIADILNKVAFEQGADLIATGAFGHSRAYDFVMGATTYALLREAKVPVMFSK